VVGVSAGPGVWGTSSDGEGVHGETRSPTMAAIAGFKLNQQRSDGTIVSGSGAAIYGKNEGLNGHAGFFDGPVEVINGDLIIDGGTIGLRNLAKRIADVEARASGLETRLIFLEARVNLGG
jgi:hypothetical protein